MTELSEEKPGKTLYDKSQYKPKISIVKILFVIIFVLGLLFAVRFLNQMLWWNVTKWEIKSSQTGRIESFNFLGLANIEKAQKKLSYFSQTSIQEKTIVSYFDLVHPAVFIINNKGAKSFVNIGMMNVYPEPGITTLSFYPSEIIETKRENSPAKALYFGHCLFPKLFETLAAHISGDGAGKGISFIFNPVEDSKYLKIPYMLYFFLPLLIIILLGAHYPKFIISFFYYAGLFLLFDFKRVFFSVPFSWLTNLLGLEVSHLVSAIISALMLTVFIAAGFAGIFYKRRRDPMDYRGYYLTYWGRGLVIFFILLPLVLRF